MLQGADELARADEHTDQTHLPLGPGVFAAARVIVTPRAVIP